MSSAQLGVDARCLRRRRRTLGAGAASMARTAAAPSCRCARSRPGALMRGGDVRRAAQHVLLAGSPFASISIDSTPFWNGITTRARRRAAAAALGAALSVSQSFTANITTSTGPISAGSLVTPSASAAGRCRARLSTVRPFLRMRREMRAARDEAHLVAGLLAGGRRNSRRRRPSRDGATMRSCRSSTGSGRTCTGLSFGTPM